MLHEFTNTVCSKLVEALFAVRLCWLSLCLRASFPGCDGIVSFEHVEVHEVAQISVPKETEFVFLVEPGSELNLLQVRLELMQKIKGGLALARALEFVDDHLTRALKKMVLIQLQPNY